MTPEDIKAYTPPIQRGPESGMIRLLVNGHYHSVALEPNVTLLDALRERLGLTGTKKGCNQGLCGACTVLIDGERHVSCLALAVMFAETPITTIEGVASEQTLHPLQAAFIEHDAFQCGYCTPGQILSAMGLLREGHAHTDEEIRLMMVGNICRCGAYAGIQAAIKEVLESRSKDAPAQESSMVSHKDAPSLTAQEVTSLPTLSPVGGAV